jgi:hypothetical protein
MLTLIDTVYINSYGGKILLDNLLIYIIENDNPKNYIYLFDSRLNLDIILKIPKSNIYILTASEIQRKKYYKKLFQNYNITKIFCFANVPPPVNCKGKYVNIYFHNTLLYANNSKLNLQLRFKNLYIQFLNKKYYNWVVQTKLVKINLSRFLFVKENMITIHPFFSLPEKKNIEVKLNVFFYPADGTRQKNHIFLFNVWEKFFLKYNYSPTLFVTIDEKKYPLLIQSILFYKKKGLNIVNLGHLNYNEIIKYYVSSKYIVFPSLTESFGLPLLEACIYNCKIIAADLEYVHEIIQPSITFNVNSEDDLVEIIYNTIKNDNFLNHPFIKIKNNMKELIKLINEN